MSFLDVILYTHLCSVGQIGLQLALVQIQILHVLNCMQLLRIEMVPVNQISGKEDPSLQAGFDLWNLFVAFSIEPLRPWEYFPNYFPLHMAKDNTPTLVVLVTQPQTTLYKLFGSLRVPDM